MSGVGPNGLLEKAYDPGAVAAADRTAPPARLGTIRALGIIQIVVAGLCLLVALGTLGLTAKTHDPPVISIFYAVAAANLLTTGIGAVRIAPWARRATLISAWIWLFIMLLAVGTAVIGAVITGRLRPRGGELVMAAVVGVPLLLIALGLPIVLIATFTRPAVRALFESRRRQAS